MPLSSEFKAALAHDREEGLFADHARWLVDYYYDVQDLRIRAANQHRAVVQETDARPLSVTEYSFSQMAEIEEEIKRALDAYSDAMPGSWAKSQVGIGPVLAAGLMAHIDITRARTAGQVWRFAGLDPSVKWIGKDGARKLVSELENGGKLSPEQLLLLAATRVDRDPEKLRHIAMTGKNGEQLKSLTRNGVIAALAKRPWNARLKVLCWKIGDSFVKFHNKDECFYGRLYAERKALEVERNLGGAFKDQASRSLEERRISDPKLKATYESGMLPDGRIELRARRYAVKIFLSHYHGEAYRDHFGEEPPVPFPVAHLGHAHVIDAPTPKAKAA
jgi:hypothetical protein